MIGICCGNETFLCGDSELKAHRVFGSLLHMG